MLEQCQNMLEDLRIHENAMGEIVFLWNSLWRVATTAHEDEQLGRYAGIAGAN